MNHYLMCRIGQEWYGIAIDYVVEVLHIVALNQVPGDAVVGMMTLREQVIPVTDLRQFFGLPADEYDVDMPIVALRHNNRYLGIIVDDADDVVSITDAELAPYDDRGIQAVARVESQMVFVLDVPFLLQTIKRNDTERAEVMQ